MPLEELWRPAGSMTSSRIRTLSRSEIGELLKVSVVEFVVADVGKRLQWIDPHQCFNFWKNEVKSHLAETDSRIELDKFPDSYFYLASQWEGEGLGHPIVLLERHH